MKNKLQIIPFDQVKRHCRSVEVAPVTLHLTPNVMATIATTVGSRPPESGAKLFGPRDREGADVLEFDVAGSNKAGQAVYSPDNAWGDVRISHWLMQPEGEQRLWTGDVHSHPNGYGLPSAEVGAGLGDLGYARAVLEAVEWMEHFFFPIVTDTLSGEPRLWPWVMLRNHPGEFFYAPVKVVEVEHFPPRQFAASWLAQVGDQTPNVEQLGLSWSMSLDLAEVATRLRSQVTRHDAGFLFERGGVGIVVELPRGFPRVGPAVAIVEGHARRPFAVRWRAEHQTRAELRLKRLIDHAFHCASREF